MNIPLNTDHPANQDAFERGDFARALAQGVASRRTEDGSLVVAINGEWGSGKTTLLGLIKTELDKVIPRPIVMDFNPWLIKGFDALLEAYLIQLSKQVMESDDRDSVSRGIKVSESIIKYLRLLRALKWVPVTGPGTMAVSAVGHFAEKAAGAGQAAIDDLKQLAKSGGLNELKDNVQKALDDLALEIVVVMDDIDRLDREEIRTLFQMVKAVASFRHVTYLLSYDSKRVAAALADNHDETDGRNYLEKIVQVAYDIPPIFPWQKRRFVDETLRRAQVTCRPELQTFEEDRWSNSIKLTAMACRHPRDVIRLANRLYISWPATREKVNACDVMLFEVLALRFPDLVKGIRDFPDLFTGGHAYSLNPSSTGADETNWMAFVEDEASRAKAWSRFLPEAPVEREIAERICEYLFPVVDTRGDKHIDSARLSLANPDHLAMLLNVGGLTGIMSAGEAYGLLSDPTRLKETLNDAFDCDLDKLLSSLTAYARLTPEVSLTSPIETLQTLVSHVQPQLDSKRLPVSRLSTYADLICNILLSRSHDRDTLILHVISNAPICLGGWIVNMAANGHNMTSGRWESQLEPNPAIEKGDTFTPPHIAAKVISIWLDKVRVATLDTLLEVEATLHDTLNAWYSYSRNTNKADVLSKAKKLCEEEKGLNVFVSIYNNLLVSNHYHQLIWDADELLKCILDNSQLAEQSQQFLTILRAPAFRERLQLLHYHE